MGGRNIWYFSFRGTAYVKGWEPLLYTKINYGRFSHINYDRFSPIENINNYWLLINLPNLTESSWCCVNFQFNTENNFGVKFNWMYFLSGASSTKIITTKNPQKFHDNNHEIIFAWAGLYWQIKSGWLFKAKIITAKWPLNFIINVVVII